MRGKDILSIEDFDPNDVDISYIQSIARDALPEEGYVDAATAERFAVLCLKAAEQATDHLAKATKYLSYCEGIVKSTKGTAIAQSKGVAASIVKEVTVNDESHQKALMKYMDALAWHEWLLGKRDVLYKTHHLFKDLAKKNTDWTPPETSEVSSIYNYLKEPVSTMKKVGEVDWK